MKGTPFKLKQKLSKEAALKKAVRDKKMAMSPARKTKKAQNQREDRRNVLENILYELLQKLLSFENADVEYKNNLSKILKQLAAKKNQEGEDYADGSDLQPHPRPRPTLDNAIAK